jgi:hypothetical protein
MSVERTYRVVETGGRLTWTNGSIVLDTIPHMEDAFEELVAQGYEWIGTAPHPQGGGRPDVHVFRKRIGAAS